ncbi:MAG: hypothetical protein GY854_11455, partial [Deltaproteobacteria bacterium]|nr:hypothetical protein [Deltaproteobacteria bacterium]
NVWVTDISEIGFTANFGTWGSSIVHQSWASYIAIGKSIANKAN